MGSKKKLKSGSVNAQTSRVDEKTSGEAQPRTEKQKIKDDKERSSAIEYFKRRATVMPKQIAAPPTQLLALIAALFAEYGFDSTAQIFQAERQARQKLNNWKDATNDNLEESLPTLVNIYEEWYNRWQSLNKANGKGPARKAKLNKNNEKTRKESPSATSSSGSSSDSTSADESPVKKSKTTLGKAKPGKATSAHSKSTSSSSEEDSTSSGSSSSDTDADDEEELATSRPNQSSRVLKGKSMSSSDSSSESESESDSDSSTASSEDESGESDEIQASNDQTRDLKKIKHTSSSTSSSESSSGSTSSEEGGKETASIPGHLAADPGKTNARNGSIDSSATLEGSDSKSPSASSSALTSALTSESEAMAPKKTPELTEKITKRKRTLSTSQAVTPVTNEADETPIIKKQKQQGVPFSRVPKDTEVDRRFASNAYVSYDYADRAHADLSIVRGKGFTKEKNKKKRGSYRGGKIDISGGKGIKFDY